jgi:hypothetical protein
MVYHDGMIDPAIGALRAGASPADVIAHYYPGTTIGRWRAPRQT